MSPFHPCALVPVYNHGATVGAVVSDLRGRGLPVFLVDDGSEPGCAAVLDALAAEDAQIILLRHPENRGKGAASCTGFRAAAETGYSHALQIDADGQHDRNDIPTLLALAAQQPAALITGRPRWDDSVPKARYYGRYVTHVFVWLHTLSLEIPDSMCGFRVYPLGPVTRLMQTHEPGRHMDFDTDIMVRLHWQGVPVVSHFTHVTYPEDGVSHFRLWGDNLAISWMHTRLIFGMLRRLPWLLARRFRKRS